MQKLMREAMHAGALGFSTAPKDRGDPAGVARRRRALGACQRARRTRHRRLPGRRRRAGRHQADPPGRPRAGGAHRTAIDLQLDVGSDRQPRRMGRAPEVARRRVQERRPLLRLVPLDRCRRDLRPASAGSTCRRTRTSRIPRASSAACRPGTRSWRCPIRTGCAPSATRKSARRCRPRRSKARSTQQGGMTDRRGRARGLFNRRWDLVEVFMTTKGQNRHLEGKSDRADRERAEQGHHGRLPRSVARRGLADLLPGDRPQPRSEGAEAHPRLAIYRDRHQRRRRPAAHRRPARDQHESAGPLGARTAGDAARRGGLSADRQDRADARHYRSRLHRRRQGRRHHDLRSRYDRIEAARAGRDACRRAACRSSATRSASTT